MDNTEPIHEMSDTNVGSDQSHNDPRPDVYTRVSKAFEIEDRDWATVNRRVATRVLAGGGVALAAFASGLAGFRAVYASKIYPNVKIGDVAVGGMTRDDATIAVQSRVDDLNEGSIKYTYQSHSWTPTLKELGITVDVDDLVDQAFALGRDDKAADRIASTGNLIKSSRVVPLVFSMQATALNSWLDSVDADINDPAIDATFTVEGASLNITDDATGIIANRDEIKTQINNVLVSLAPTEGDLPTAVDQPRITKKDLEANEAQVLNILSNSVTVRFEDKRWELAPEEVSEFMIFTSSRDSGTLETSVDFDRDGLNAYLRNRFTEEVNRDPINSQVQFYNGKLSATTNAQDGKTIKNTQFAELVAASFLGNHERVDVPVVTTQAKVRQDNLDTLGIKESLCRVDSNFQNSSDDRAHNILTGIGLINNTIVAPGDDFSFNRAVGPIDGNPDFIGGTGIVGGIIQDEFGGGICQVVTTAFRAAIMAGLPITQWYPHTYRLTGYELDGWGPGFDASILQPEWEPDLEEWADLRFTNNTKNFILISSWSDNGFHIMEIYGTKDGREVTISDTATWEAEPSEKNSWRVDPEAGAGTNILSAYPVDGLNASFTRTVSGVEGEEAYERTFVSPYQSRGFQCTCSEDMYEIPCW